MYYLGKLDSYGDKRGNRRIGVDFNLTDKVLIVTGASRGSGEGIAETFAEYGAKVVPTSRKQEALGGVAKSTNEADGEVLPSESAS